MPHETCCWQVINLNNDLAHKTRKGYYAKQNRFTFTLEIRVFHFNKKKKKNNFNFIRVQLVYSKLRSKAMSFGI